MCFFSLFFHFSFFAGFIHLAYIDNSGLRYMEYGEPLYSRYSRFFDRLVWIKFTDLSQPYLKTQKKKQEKSIYPTFFVLKDQICFFYYIGL